MHSAWRWSKKHWLSLDKYRKSISCIYCPVVREIYWDLFLLNTLVNFLKNGKFCSVFLKYTISNYSFTSHFLAPWCIISSYFSLTILTDPPGFLFKIKNKKLRNTTILSVPIQKKSRKKWACEWWKCRWYFYLWPRILKKNQISFALRNCFLLGEKQIT